MRYMVSLNPYSISEFGRVRHRQDEHARRPGLHVPQPDPARDRLWLFWRGGAWNPTFSWTDDGYKWAPARELVDFGHAQRPYTKYVGRNDAIHGIFTDGHPQNWKNSLHYLRLEGRKLFAASGRRLGTLDDVPLHTSRLDHIYNYSDQGGRAWGHDIALTAEGRPRVVYTRRVANRDTFYYAYHTARGGSAAGSWRRARAGRRSTPGGASFDHADPRIVYLSRTIGPWNQVEEWFTPDNGRTWTHRQLTNDPEGYAIRPVVPRGHTGSPRPDPLRVGRRAHDRLHGLHVARARDGLLTGAAACAGRRPPDRPISRRAGSAGPRRCRGRRRCWTRTRRRVRA